MATFRLRWISPAANATGGQLTEPTEAPLVSSVSAPVGVTRQANVESSPSSDLNNSRDGLRPEIADAIQPWNPEMISHALRFGWYVIIWSRALDRWCVWVHDEKDKARAALRYVETPIFTLAELKGISESGCSPELLRSLVQTQDVFGYSCPVSVERQEADRGELPLKRRADATGDLK